MGIICHCPSYCHCFHMSWYHCIGEPSVILPMFPHVMVSLYQSSKCHIATATPHHGITVSVCQVSYCHCFPAPWFHCIRVSCVILPLFPHVMVSLYLSAKYHIATVCPCHGITVSEFPVFYFHCFLMSWLYSSCDGWEESCRM